MRRTLRAALRTPSDEQLTQWPCGCTGYMVEYREHGCAEHGYWSPDAYTRVANALLGVDLERTQELPILIESDGPQIRADVVSSVRFALASLPEQSRMLRERGMHQWATVCSDAVALPLL